MILIHFYNQKKKEDKSKNIKQLTKKIILQIVI